jgi:hypothetical protein
MLKLIGISSASRRSHSTYVFRVLCSLLLLFLIQRMSRSIFFCTPVHSFAPDEFIRGQAPGMVAGIDNKPFRASQHSTLARRTGSPACTQRLRVEPRVQGVSAWLCSRVGLFYLTMLVREPVHGMQGPLERQRYGQLPKPVDAISQLCG